MGVLMSNQVPIMKNRKIAIISTEIGWGSRFKAAEIGSQFLFEAGIADRPQATVTRITSIPSMLDGEITTEETETSIVDHAMTKTPQLHANL
jgi:hypothetical protein